MSISQSLLSNQTSKLHPLSMKPNPHSSPKFNLQHQILQTQLHQTTPIFARTQTKIYQHSLQFKPLEIPLKIKYSSTPFQKIHIKFQNPRNPQGPKICTSSSPANHHNPIYSSWPKPLKSSPKSQNIKHNHLPPNYSSWFQNQRFYWNLRTQPHFLWEEEK